MRSFFALRCRALFGAATLLALAGCATPPPAAPPLEHIAPPAWIAPLPHAGSAVALAGWWRAGGDATLTELIDAALQGSPSLAAAEARVAQARAQVGSQRAGLLPQLGAAASATRGNAGSVGSTPPGSDPPIATTLQAGVQASWEIDLFGRQRALVGAATARAEGAQALAHLARVALVGDVASSYHGLRLCQSLLETARQDAASRGETARLARISRDAGFTAPATAALADASAADGRARTTQQQATCDAQRKALVALTGLPEPDIEQKMALARANSSQSALFSIATLPADTLRQRPDVWAAEREVLAARAELASADAARWPGLSLAGNIGALQLRAGGGTRDFSTWQFGPLQLSLPIFDGGRIAAGQAAARARYDEAVANYQGKVRQAVQEVETALTQGAAARGREADARAAVAGYRQQFAATEALYRQGMANLPQLEEARRNLLGAETALAQLLHEQQAAGVALYKAAGGGWQAPAP
ncbi:efflux transporter outer membrane subunit [Ottowia testudinis]|uniref:Efflux transporter outer membrane subunit n=1 Tax=Ottowia testudinis TaxID=2816950 RepID=A0A975H5Q3_9BURK|nr:efflux transporter outer membrane subunit [Ottowia testudinis]QTD45197.1 efflux transporter outer membrane subunit [Ottowia testudinis]